MIPLNLADCNVEVIIRRIAGKQEMKRHLENLGFVVGAAVRVISENSGNVIVDVKESRIAISSEAASHIYV